MIAVIDELTERTVLLLPGVTAMSHLHDGRATTYTTSDRTPRTDGRVILSRRLSVAGVFTGSQQEIQRQVDTLLNLRAAGSSVAVQVPGRAPIPSMLVERLIEDTDRTTGRPFSLDLVERRTATAQTITLAATAVARGPARRDVAPGLDAAEDVGVRPTRDRSLLGTLLGVGS